MYNVIFTDRDQLDFDVEVAIKVCRQAGYNKHALELAKKHGLHHWYLQIQLEDLKKFEEGLDYISSLDFVNAQSNIKKYGTTLMKHLPGKTTEFLKLICTDFKSKHQPLISEDVLAGRVSKFVELTVAFSVVLNSTLNGTLNSTLNDTELKKIVSPRLVHLLKRLA